MREAGAQVQVLRLKGPFNFTTLGLQSKRKIREEKDKSSMHDAG